MRDDVTVEISGPETADELRSLYRWLWDEDEFRGRVRLVESAPKPGSLGGVPEILTLALGPGGAGIALASVIISWIRHRKSEVSCKLTRPDGAAVEVSASLVNGMDEAALRALVADMRATLDQRVGDDDEVGTTGGGPAGAG